MTENHHPLIEPVTDDKRKKEKLIYDNLYGDEIEAICSIIPKYPASEDLLEIIEDTFDFAIKMTAKYSSPKTPPVKCKEGCTWCCFQNVFVSALEAFRISKFVTEGDIDFDTQTQIINNLRNLNDKILGKTSVNRSILKLPCAFLIKNRCIIYPVRPLACAEFTSFDVEDCKEGYKSGFGPESVIHDKARLIVFRAIQQGLFKGLKISFPKSNNNPLELTSAVIETIDTEDCETKWIKGEDILLNAILKE